MIENHNTAAGRGHVRAVFSERCRGFAAPLDLVRAHLRAVWGGVRGHLAVVDLCDCAAMAGDAQDDELRALEMRGRVRAAFADYLVSDDEAGYPFREARNRHRPENDRLAMTGRGPWSFDLQSGLFDGGHGCMDAPNYLAGGGMRSYRCDVSGDRVKAPLLWVRW